MNLYKPTYYSSVLISLIAICIVVLIWTGAEEFLWGLFTFDLSSQLSTMLYLAYTTMLLIISSVLLPLISNSIKNQSNQLLKIGMILLSLFFAVFNK